MTATRPSTRLLVAVGLLALTAGACSSDSDTKTTTAGPTTAAGAVTTVPGTDTPGTTAPETTAHNYYTGKLSGVLEIDPGACADGAVTGSYFQMVMPGGTAEAGPFIANADSACSDTNYTLLTYGTEDGGLFINDVLQTAPDPAFDSVGNGLADRIIVPVKFFGVAFTIAVDAAGPAPSIIESNGGLTGDLSAITAYYGNGVFNQGAPKPDGSGTPPTGTLDPVNGHYTLTWTSLIVGGSFDGFVGVWHLAGKFTPYG